MLSARLVSAYICTRKFPFPPKFLGNISGNKAFRAEIYYRKYAIMSEEIRVGANVSLLFSSTVCASVLVLVRLGSGVVWTPEHLEHLECSHQPHIQGRRAEKRTQRGILMGPPGMTRPRSYGDPRGWRRAAVGVPRLSLIHI